VTRIGRISLFGRFFLLGSFFYYGCNPKYWAAFCHGSFLFNFWQKLAWAQGDQIGRIFAQWVIVCLGQLHENERSSLHFWATLFSC
jgi:hypothetical protein